MIIKNIILENRYYDSVVLMNASGKIKLIPFIEEASLMMGTGANKELLKALKLLSDEGEMARAGDLIMALAIDDDVENIDMVLKEAIKELEKSLAPRGKTEDDQYNPRSIDGALEILKDANIAVVSIPGEHVGYTANQLLNRNLHVMIFSDNVPLETEIALKRKGEKMGLLVMGPDCGTAIINGVALGFANKVRKGKIGIVAASGTGIQEASTLIHKMGRGVSHAIGTGGKDLSKEVGGITMKMGIKALMEDPFTEVLLLISKPPHPDVEKEIFKLLEGAKKPVVINFLGSKNVRLENKNIEVAYTLEEAALMALRASGEEVEISLPKNIEDIIENRLNLLNKSQKYLRGLYSGGTLANETRIMLEKEGLNIYSNLTKNKENRLDNPFISKQNSIVDMGEDIFTKGAPHPMIDSTKRIDRILQEAKDPQTAVILLDLVLGYGANMNPAPDIAEVLKKSQSLAQKEGRHLIFVCSVCGVKEDPQDADKQIKILEDAGTIVFPSNASATKFISKILCKI